MTIESKQIATPAGATLPQDGFSLISNHKLIQLYTTMLKCRMTDERISTFTRRDKSTAPNAATGQEAVVAGVGLGLLRGDTLAPSPGGLIPCFVKGLPLSRIFSALSSPGTQPRPRYAPLKLIPPSLSLRAQLQRAIGAAMANKKSKNGKIAVAFCGASCDAPDPFQEVMRRAGKLSLPILLVCQSGPHSEEIFLRAEACGFPGVAVDGDDAVAVYRVATEAMAHARRGSGPTLIECRPWVLPGQRPGRRRAAGNPILKMENYLTRKGLFDRKLKSTVIASFRRELDAAVKQAGGMRP